MDNQEIERYGTIPTWAKELSINENVIRARIDNTVAILGRSTRGNIQRFFAESHILERCKDMLENIPMANDQGYFTLNEDGQDIVYGNAVYWARQFGVSQSEIWRRVKELQGIDGRSSVGRIYRNAFFTEPQIRPLIEDLLIETPKLNEEGWLIIQTDEGERCYGTLLGWSKELGISRPTLRTKLDQRESLLVRNRQEARVKVYTEEVVREACGDLLDPLPKADEDDSIRLEQDGRAVEYRTLKGWRTVRAFNRGSMVRILEGAPYIKGKDRLGRICSYYNEEYVIDIETAVKKVPPPVIKTQESVPLETEAIPSLPALCANPEGFLEHEGCIYGTYGAWANKFGIPKTTFYKKLQGLPVIMARQSPEEWTVVAMYPETAIRPIVEKRLEREEAKQTYDQLSQGEERHLTVKQWAKELGVSHKTIQKVVRDLQPRIGTDVSGKVLARLYGENAVRQACALALSGLFQADKSGFFILDGIRYGNAGAWCKTFGISRKMLERVIPKEERINGKDSSGRICEQSFYAESLVHERCKEALTDLPKADKDGFFSLEGERWATAARWARELKIDNAAIGRKVGHIGTKRGFAKHGVICDFLPESKVREACKENIELPHTQPDNTFFIDSERYATRNKWAEILGIPVMNIRERTTDMEGVSANIPGVGVLEKAFYSETDIRTLCADLLDFPKSNEDGFIEQEDKRYGTLHAWIKELGPCFKAMASRIQSLPSIKGRNRKNAICEYYEEQDVLVACADLIKDLPETDETGFITFDSVRYSTVHRLAETFGVASITMKRRLGKYAPIKGRTSGNKICDFYKEEDARTACADLLSSRNGTAE